MGEFLRKAQLGEHLFNLIQAKSQSLLADYKSDKLPLSRSAIYNLKDGIYSEHTLKVVSEWLGIEIETLYLISNSNPTNSNENN